jgi:hypothetical protein
MRFYLVYKGQLSSTQGNRGKRKKERLLIRKQITPQIERLWETSWTLSKMQWDSRVAEEPANYLGSGSDSPLPERYKSPPIFPVQEGHIDLTAPIEKLGKKFKPLIRKSMDLTCTLNVLFLRQEDPGSLLKKGGDIDNRIKTFIDALEMPSDELEGDETEGVNLCLLENDSLVKSLEINTERLLLPETNFPNEVNLIVEVVVHVERVGTWNMCLL